MAFGERRIDTIDDITAALSATRGRVVILAARLRMHLTEADVAELEGILDDADRIQAYTAELRARLSREYLVRIGKN